MLSFLNELLRALGSFVQYIPTDISIQGVSDCEFHIDAEESRFEITFSFIVDRLMYFSFLSTDNNKWFRNTINI